ncbi:hypothetical protein DFR50_10454 [Roseiarcus fermentans]|uniref:Uncharacterized protein n=1 Tax=Roseiarcus fermentans TaxID=1473586 RepID=A0A366FQD0_9HYPH|nr:hypothetical protein DFR50_10454 [Roseiarcus fermentans]
MVRKLPQHHQKIEPATGRVWSTGQASRGRRSIHRRPDQAIRSAGRGSGIVRPSASASSSQQTMAAPTLRAASSRVSPSDMQPGRSGTVARKPPPSSSDNGSMTTAFASEFLTASINRASVSMTIEEAGARSPTARDDVNRRKAQHCLVLRRRLFYVCSERTRQEMPSMIVSSGRSPPRDRKRRARPSWRGARRRSHPGAAVAARGSPCRSSRRKPTPVDARPLPPARRPVGARESPVTPNPVFARSKATKQPMPPVAYCGKKSLRLLLATKGGGTIRGRNSGPAALDRFASLAMTALLATGLGVTIARENGCKTLIRLNPRPGNGQRGGHGEAPANPRTAVRRRRTAPRAPTIPCGAQPGRASRPQLPGLGAPWE